ncbi:hypothetical protein LP414_27315 [Polaromonas sp. P1(28)-13]|nr:hypothetical protein LP414_27315 [Polaromonas sp. P1(28)-13]
MTEVTNMFEFRRAKEAEKLASAPTSETVAAMEEARGLARPSHAGYPDSTVHLIGKHDAQPTASNISHTAAGQVLGALQFYANQGFDHGVQARKALIGMATVIESGEGSRA